MPAPHDRKTYVELWQRPIFERAIRTVLERGEVERARQMLREPPPRRMDPSAPPPPDWPAELYELAGLAPQHGGAGT